jgi:hypothetical protein
MNQENIIPPRTHRICGALSHGGVTARPLKASADGGFETA